MSDIILRKSIWIVTGMLSWNMFFIMCATLTLVHIKKITALFFLCVFFLNTLLSNWSFLIKIKSEKIFERIIYTRIPFLCYRVLNNVSKSCLPCMHMIHITFSKCMKITVLFDRQYMLYTCSGTLLPICMSHVLIILFSGIVGFLLFCFGRLFEHVEVGYNEGINIHTYLIWYDFVRMKLLKTQLP